MNIKGHVHKLITQLTKNFNCPGAIMNHISHRQTQAVLKSGLQPLAFNIFNGRGLSDDNDGQIPLISALSEQTLSELIKKSKTLKYLRRWTIDTECDRDDSIYIILTGKVSLFNAQCNQTVQLHDSDSCLREIAILSGKLRSSAIISLERTLFTTVKNVDFINWLMKHPEVTFNYVDG